MKRLCICLLCVLLALTACGKAQTVPTDEMVSAVTDAVTLQTQTPPSEPETDPAGQTTEQTTEQPTQTASESQTEPVTTGTRREAQSEATATAAATTRAQTTRETHTLFPIPVRTTSARTTASTTTTTTRPTTTTTTTRPTTTTTTTQAPGNYVPPVQPVRNACTFTIDCRELRQRPEKLKNPGKMEFVPQNGYIVKDLEVEFKSGESVFDVLRRVCATHTCTDNCAFCQKDRSIQMESTYTPQFDSYYVEGIHQLYEKDCGGTSGWTYWVNGVFPNYGCSDYKVKPGDQIVWVYSIEMDANETF